MTNQKKLDLSAEMSTTDPDAAVEAVATAMRDIIAATRFYVTCQSEAVEAGVTEGDAVTASLQSANRVDQAHKLLLDAANEPSTHPALRAVAKAAADVIEAGSPSDLMVGAATRAVPVGLVKQLRQDLVRAEEDGPTDACTCIGCMTVALMSFEQDARTLAAIHEAEQLLREQESVGENPLDGIELPEELEEALSGDNPDPEAVKQFIALVTGSLPKNAQPVVVTRTDGDTGERQTYDAATGERVYAAPEDIIGAFVTKVAGKIN